METIFSKLKGAGNTYWGNIKEGIGSLKLGLKITWRHFKVGLIKKKRDNRPISSANYFEQHDGIFTLEYPKEAIPVPVNGRYRLNNVMEDCIVCDKCAKICPVNCIDIVPIKSPTEIGKASDGSSIRLHAAKFDIDMAKCCYCGLCTTVCPTECLTMTNTFDYSEFDITKLNYEYGLLSPEESVKKQKEYDEFQEKKRADAEARKSAAGAGVKSTGPKIPGMNPKVGAAKPAIPGAKKAVAPKIPVPKLRKTDAGEETKAGVVIPKGVSTDASASKVKPKVVIPSKKTEASVEGEAKKAKPRPKPVMKPKIKPKPKSEDES